MAKSRYHSCKRVKGGACLCRTKKGKARFAKRTHCK